MATTGLAKDVQRYHEDNVQAAHTVPVAVAFRLYEKLGSGGAGAFKLRSKDSKNATEPFWMYFFQECWDKSVQLTHEIYVNEKGEYNHFDCHNHSETEKRPEGLDPYRSVVLSSAHYDNGVRRAYLYHVLLSPFQMPTSRLDKVIPGGKIAKGDSGKYAQFIAWSKKRELNRIAFTPMEEKRGATRCLWSPWMMAWALADQCGEAVYNYQKYVLDQADLIQVASLALSLSGATKLEEYVSMDNINALLNETTRAKARLAEAAKPVCEYVEKAPFMEMLDDIDADDTEDAMIDTLPYLSDIYRVVSPDVLSKLVNPRYFDYKLNAVDRVKLVRRASKALWEVNLMFAKALQRPGVSSPDISRFVRGAQWWSRKLFGVEVEWENGRFNQKDLKAMQRAAVRAPYFLSFVLCLDAFNAYTAVHKLQSKSSTTRDTIAAIGAMSSAFSSAAKVADAVVADPERLRTVREAAKGLAKLEPAEEALLHSWASSRTAQRLGTVARNQLLKSTLGVVSGAADAFTAATDGLIAMQTGDTGAAAFYGLIVLGGLFLILSAPAGGAFWLAALGQTLELTGFIGSGILQSSELEIWLRFCAFGRKAADKDLDLTRSWTDGHSLSQVAQSPRLQIASYGNIVYHMEIDARIVDYERVESLFYLTVKFAYCLPENGQLYLHVEVLRNDGSVEVARNLSPWSNATHAHASDKRTTIALSDGFPAREVLDGIRSVTVGLKLQIDKTKDAFFPEEGLVVKKFDVPTLHHDR
jgi:hypothetical protein